MPPEVTGFEVSSLLLESSDLPVCSLATGRRGGFEKERAEDLVAGCTCEDLLVTLDGLVTLSRGDDL